MQRVVDVCECEQRRTQAEAVVANNCHVLMYCHVRRVSSGLGCDLQGIDHRARPFAQSTCAAGITQRDSTCFYAQSIQQSIELATLDAEFACGVRLVAVARGENLQHVITLDDLQALMRSRTSIAPD